MREGGRKRHLLYFSAKSTAVIKNKKKQVQACTQTEYLRYIWKPSALWSGIQGIREHGADAEELRLWENSHSNGETCARTHTHGPQCTFSARGHTKENVYTFQAVAFKMCRCFVRNRRRKSKSRIPVRQLRQKCLAQRAHADGGQHLDGNTERQPGLMYFQILFFFFILDCSVTD